MGWRVVEVAVYHLKAIGRGAGYTSSQALSHSRLRSLSRTTWALIAERALCAASHSTQPLVAPALCWNQRWRSEPSVSAARLVCPPSSKQRDKAGDSRRPPGKYWLSGSRAPPLHTATSHPESVSCTARPQAARTDSWIWSDYTSECSVMCSATTDSKDRLLDTA